MVCIHNPKVGGSIPPPATNKINELKSYDKREIGALVHAGERWDRKCTSGAGPTELPAITSTVSDKKIII